MCHYQEPTPFRAKETVYSVVVAADLRVIFVLHGNIAYTLDIGTHALYRT